MTKPRQAGLVPSVFATSKTPWMSDWLASRWGAEKTIGFNESSEVPLLLLEEKPWDRMNLPVDGLSRIWYFKF